MDGFEKVITALLHLSLSFIKLVSSVFFNGYAVMLLWNWFMVPALGAKPLSFVLAMGVSMVWGYLSYQEVPVTNADMKQLSIKLEPGEALLKSFGEALCSVLRPALSISLGYFIHLFL